MFSMVSAGFPIPSKFSHTWHPSLCSSYTPSHGQWGLPHTVDPGSNLHGCDSLSGSDQNVIKSTPRHFLEGKEIHPRETVCLWPRGQLGHGTQEKVSGAVRHSTKQILQIPISKLLNAEQEILQITSSLVPCLSPSHKSSILPLHKKWNITFIFLFYCSILRNRRFWHIGLRIEIDNWNICHGRNESLIMLLLVGEGLLANQSSGD